MRAPTSTATYLTGAATCVAAHASSTGAHHGCWLSIDLAARVAEEEAKLRKKCGHTQMRMRTICIMRIHADTCRQNADKCGYKKLRHIKVASIYYVIG